jgi:hypothetical protein
MMRLDRRQKTALDEAYRISRAVSKEEVQPDIFQLVRCLKTVEHALNGARDGQLTLTIRLWQRIRQALFDKIITSFPAHIVIFTADGKVLEPRNTIPDGASLEMRPEGLRRADDVFVGSVDDLNPNTRYILNRVWTERGSFTKREDFNAFVCGEVCAPKSFVVGAEILESETQIGKERAYRQWWDLYWQAYCCQNHDERRELAQRMESLEAVWGNLYY